MSSDKAVIATVSMLRRRTDPQPLSDSISEYANDMSLLHSLQVHKLELESQNDELRRSMAELLERDLNIIKFAPAGYFCLDSNGFILSVNNAWLRMHGYDSSDEVIGKHFSIMLTDYDSELSLKHMTDLQNGLPVPTGEFFSRRKDGSIGCHTFSAHPVLHADKVVGLEWFVIDISERKQAELYRDMSREILQILNEPGELREFIPRIITTMKARTGFDAVGIRLQDGDDYPYYSQEGFPNDLLVKENSLMERTADGVVCRDKDGHVNLECICGLVISGKIDQNGPFFTSGGSFWANDTLPLLNLPPDKDPRFNPRNECIHHGYASVVLVPIRTKQNIIGLIQFNDKRKGRFTLESVALLEDIALHIGAALARKQDEKEKVKLEAQLHQAQKMESIGTLAGGVAHDFNNMLTVILGYSNLAIRENDLEKLHAYQKEIIKASEKSSDLTRQLLAFARKQAIAPKVLDLNETVANTLKMLHRLIGEHVSLTWQPAADLWLLKIDPSQIDQILANLCVNARDAISGNGKIFIETANCNIDDDYCSKHTYALPGEYVRLAVSDNGAGMKNETLSHIFEPFFTTKEIGRGTGLGLATVFGVIKQNNGFINVNSEPDLGTMFKIYLPRYVGNDEKTSAAHTATTTPLGHETVLLVEDEPAILDVAATILTNLGYTVLQANTPEVAILLANEHGDKISLLITDVIMPGMNGKDLAHQLQTKIPQVKNLFMSGYTSDVIAQHGVLDDGVNFLQKPFSLHDLAAKVREVLDSK